ncbi:MAG: TetR/AcrR family transcriptional regulator [Spirochaetes bacterium]|nr:TetR/AcrR family transcriptional regulator [Spirochaetota bacterium]
MVDVTVSLYDNYVLKEKGGMMTRSDDTREKILYHAKRLFSEKGYYSAQISDIIESAKIGRGTVYQYFSNKEHLFISLLERFLMDWEDYLKQLSILEDLSVISHHVYLKKRIYQAFQFFFTDRDRANIILRVGLGLPEHFEQKIQHFENKLINLIIEDLKIAVEFGHISKDTDLSFTANLVAGGVFRVAHYYLTIEPNDDTLLHNIDIISDKAAKIIGRGIFNKK